MRYRQERQVAIGSLQLKLGRCWSGESPRARCVCLHSSSRDVLSFIPKLRVDLCCTASGPRILTFSERAGRRPRAPGKKSQDKSRLFFFPGAATGSNATLARRETTSPRSKNKTKQTSQIPAGIGDTNNLFYVNTCVCMCVVCESTLTWTF